jgi:hypothetical protein
MTPKEKAKQLHILFSNAIPSSKAEWYESKQCALIAVDEILSELAYTQNYVEDAMNKIQVYIIYWQEVKQEIEKL